MPSELPFASELAFAQKLAQTANDIMLQHYNNVLNFTAKDDLSPVTEADETVNRMVIEAIQGQFPDDGVLGEEESWQADRQRLWICDPIDATMSFMMRVPTFMFSLALVIDGQPVVAVTSNPVTGDTYWAITGHGSFRNGQPIHVSSRQLANAWLAFPTNTRVVVGAGDMYQELRARAFMVDGIHGTVCKGMLIAQGSCDGSVWPGSVKPWDAAAVKLIVEEAGGRFTNRHDGGHRVDAELTEGMIVTNGVIHDDVLAIMNAS